MATSLEVAEWMLSTIHSQKMLDQEVAVYEIETKFGSKFVYINENGNPAISRDVLKCFKSISEKAIVWDKSERYWRFRDKNDSPGRNQI